MIAPAKGWEHFAQKGAVIRGAHSPQLEHRLSPDSTGDEQAAQDAG
jgi:hypothetical protein